MYISNDNDGSKDSSIKILNFITVHLAIQGRVLNRALLYLSYFKGAFFSTLGHNSGKLSMIKYSIKILILLHMCHEQGFLC